MTSNRERLKLLYRDLAAGLQTQEGALCCEKAQPRPIPKAGHGGIHDSRPLTDPFRYLTAPCPSDRGVSDISKGQVLEQDVASHPRQRPPSNLSMKKPIPKRLKQPCMEKPNEIAASKLEGPSQEPSKVAAIDNTVAEAAPDDFFDMVIVDKPDDFDDDTQSCIIDNSPYTIQAIPGKGLGVIATKAITRGTRILTETPVMHLNQPDKHYRAPDSQFRDLSDDDKESVLSLYNYCEDKGTLMGILWTNAIPLPGRYPECGLFIEASRINHACYPNTVHTWNEEARELRTYAIRDINEGEEITNKYTSGFAEYATRQRHLKEVFGFTCQCYLCSLPAEERDKSDERIWKINQLEKRLNQLKPKHHPIPMLKYIGELLQLYRDEDVVDDSPVDIYLLAEKIADEMGDWRRLAVFIDRRSKLEEMLGKSTKDESELDTSDVLRRFAISSWRQTGGKGGGFWPDVDSEGFEDWLFEEKQWSSLKERYPSSHTWCKINIDNDLPGEEEWEVIRYRDDEPPRYI